jgi:HSP20 family protein
MSTLTRHRNPFDVFAKLSSEMNDWFGRDFPTRPLLAGFPTPPEAFFTSLDIEESENEYIVRLDIPGIAEKEIKVNCTAEQLQVSGERKEEKSETKGTPSTASANTAPSPAS